jgi:ligand-binding SRPBCC domain-containing protein
MRLARPRGEVVSFFARAENLGEITPPELRFEYLTTLPIVMESGTLIDYRLHLHGIPMRWRTRIAQWDPPYRFVDEQLAGPYRKWVHTHTFRATNACETEIDDEVLYELPFWPVGELAAPLVAWQIRRIFAFREQQVRALLGVE